MYYDRKIKILVVGNCGVGKTHFLSLLSKNEYYTDYGPTIGVDFCIVKINSRKLNIWELSGNKAFDKITMPYMKDAQLALIFFSYQMQDPYKNIITWEEKIRLHNERVPIYYVGIGNSGGGKQPAPHIYNLEKFTAPIVKALMKTIMEDFIKEEVQELEEIPLIKKTEDENTCWKAFKRYCLQRYK